MRRCRLPSPLASTLLAIGLAAMFTACTTAPAPDGPPRKETVVAVTASNQLIRFNAGQPARLLSTKPLAGLQPGETVLGLDYRVVKGWLYAVGSTNRLYRINTLTGIATPVGEPFQVALTGTHFGIDFNPTVDRLRVVSDTGQNLRVHPDTAAVVDGDPAQPAVQGDTPLAYAAGDAKAGQRPALVAAAYTYNHREPTWTTNFALDAAAGSLVTQGTREGEGPAVSPSTGQLFTIGPLGTAAFSRAAFDIADVSGAAFAALTTDGASASRWVEIDLATGAAREIGTIAGGEAVNGIAIEP